MVGVLKPNLDQTMKKRLSILLLSVFIASCGANKATLKHTAENPLLSASSERMEKGLNDGRDVTLSKSALQHLFLLGAAQISTLPAASGSGLAHKLVFFERLGDALYMFESRNGKAASTSVDSKILLAEFPVLKEDAEHITFDFKAGMTKLFVKRGMSSSGRNPNDTVLNVTNSYIAKAETRGDVFFIDQILRVNTEATASAPSRNLSLHMKFTLRSYVANPDFEAKESTKLEKVGHFEIHPTIEAGTGKSVTNIMKFDTSKPVIFHLSANIPNKHRKAVEKGVLYWNKAFDKEVIQVKDLPAGISVHEPGFHILQWLDWDTAGYAYADMTGDPLTGEILQAHVYMTSTFAVSSLKNAKRQFRRYLSQQRKNPIEENFEILLGLQGFDESTFCQRPFHPSLAKSISDIINLASENGLNEQQDSSELEEIFLRVTNDYITEVVAHEIGHTLGLRHNFAASLMTSLNQETYPHISKAYFLTGELPESVLPGGSVMDYVPLLTGAMIGAHIRKDRKILPYDGEAMKYAYTSAKLEEIKSLPFCTDDDRPEGKFKDCQIWDMTSNPFLEAKQNVVSALQMRGEILALALSDSDKPELLSLSTIRKAVINPQADAQRIMKEDYAALVAMTGDSAEFVSQRHQFPFKLSLSENIEYQAATKEFQKSQLVKNAGLGRYILSPLELDETGSLKARAFFENGFEQSLQKLYPSANPEVLLQAKNTANLYWRIFQAEILKEIPSAFPSSHQFSSVDQTWFTSLGQFLDMALFTTTDEVIATSEQGEKIYAWSVSHKTPNGAIGVRENLSSLLVLDFHKQSPSYKRRLMSLKNPLMGKFKVWENTILGSGTEEELTDELYDLLQNERKIFSRF